MKKFIQWLAKVFNANITVEKEIITEKIVYLQVGDSIEGDITIKGNLHVIGNIHSDGEVSANGLKL